MINKEKVRKDTEGITDCIYFNSASSSLRTKQVTDKIVNYLLEEGKKGGYETANKYKEELDSFYVEAAKLINASPDEIALTENASVAWCNAFFSISFEPGDTILTTENEYATNFINFLKVKQEKQVVIKVIPQNASGEVDIEILKSLITPEVKLIAVTHIPTNGGLVNPIEEIGNVAEHNNILYLVDTCQSIGHYPLDVKKIKCDFLTATGRKYLRGPRGTGFLYVKKTTLTQLTPGYLDLHSAQWINQQNFKIASNASRFETWENNKSAQLGLAEAIKYVNQLGVLNIWEEIVELGNYLRSILEKTDRVKVLDQGTTKCGIVTFIIDGIEPDNLQKELFKKNVNTNVSTKGSTLIDMEKRQLKSLNRASVHYFNTYEEIDLFGNILNNIVKNY